MQFTYEVYGRLLDTLKCKGYNFVRYGTDFTDRQYIVILRHDVDMSLEKAVEMSNFEKRFDKNLIPTYFILISSDFYNPFSYESICRIDKIRSNGHDIGLHFDEKKYFPSGGSWNSEAVIEKILYEKRLMESMLGFEISTVSMHTPSRKTLNADLQVPGMINSYSQEFFNNFKYVSDSYHRWRENVWEIIENKPSKLHILTHAFWYNDVPKSRNQSFREYISGGQQHRYRLLEQNVLPPGVTLEQSMADPEGEIVL